jgi:hypothetical protein
MCLCPKSPWFAIHVNSAASLAIERDFAVAIASEARKVSQELAKQREYALIAVSEVGKKNQKLQEFFGERELQNHAHSSYNSTGKRYNCTCCIRGYNINPESWRSAD